jgi:hypothetical protein
LIVCHFINWPALAPSPCFGFDQALPSNLAVSKLSASKSPITSSVKSSIPQLVWWMTNHSRVPSNLCEMTSERMASSVAFLRGRDRAARGASVRGQRAPPALAVLSAIIPSTFRHSQQLGYAWPLPPDSASARLRLLVTVPPQAPRAPPWRDVQHRASLGRAPGTAASPHVRSVRMSTFRCMLVAVSTERPALIADWM